MRPKALFLRNLLLACLMATLAACGADQGQKDLSPPSMNLGASNNGAIWPGAVFAVKAEDPESGIRSLEVRLDGVVIDRMSLTDGEISEEPAVLEVTITSAITVGTEYQYSATAINGAGMQTERKITLIGAAEAPDSLNPADPSEPKDPTDPISPTDPTSPDGSQPAEVSVQWISPDLNAPARGTIFPRAEVTTEAEVTRAVFELVHASGSQPISMADAGNGVYMGELDTLRHAGGEYTLHATIHTQDGGKGEASLDFTIQPQLPTISFLYLPNSGVGLAGRAEYEISYTAPRGFASLRVSLVDGTGETQLSTHAGLSDEGTVRDSFVSLVAPPGRYALNATVSDVLGNVVKAAPVEIEILPPFTIDRPADGAEIDDAGGIRVITVGASGTLKGDIAVTHATLYVNGRLLERLPAIRSGDNTVVIFEWNPGVERPGVHDPRVPGDRLLTVEVEYEYPSDDGLITGSRFTDGLLLNYRSVVEPPPVAVRWSAPEIGGLARDRIRLAVDVDPDLDVAVTSTKFLLVDASTEHELSLTGLGNGLYEGELNTLVLEEGEYVLEATVTTADGRTGVASRSLRIAPQRPTLAFGAGSPNPGQRLAGRVQYELPYAAPRGFDVLEVSFNGKVLETNRGLADAGTVSGSFMTLEVKPGPYKLMGTLTDQMGNRITVELPIEILPPFAMVTPTSRESVGPGADRRQVSVTLGVNGTARNDLRVTAAQFHVGPAEYRNDAEGISAEFTIVEAGFNHLIVYDWDTAPAPSDPSLPRPVIGAHDPNIVGDRTVSVLVHFEYEDALGNLVQDSVFTEGVVLNYEP